MNILFHLLCEHWGANPVVFLYSESVAPLLGGPNPFLLCAGVVGPLSECHTQPGQPSRPTAHPRYGPGGGHTSQLQGTHSLGRDRAAGLPPPPVTRVCNQGSGTNLPLVISVAPHPEPADPTEGGMSSRNNETCPREAWRGSGEG